MKLITTYTIFFQVTTALIVIRVSSHTQNTSHIPMTTMHITNNFLSAYYTASASGNPYHLETVKIQIFFI